MDFKKIGFHQTRCTTSELKRNLTRLEESHVVWVFEYVFLETISYLILKLKVNLVTALS